MIFQYNNKLAVMRIFYLIENTEIWTTNKTFYDGFHQCLFVSGRPERSMLTASIEIKISYAKFQNKCLSFSIKCIILRHNKNSFSLNRKSKKNKRRKEKWATNFRLCVRFERNGKNFSIPLCAAYILWKLTIFTFHRKLIVQKHFFLLSFNI